MENIFDSEIPNSSPSLFLPSEPPDVRNWFPSYEYESFVLDTYDPIGGSVFKESDREEDKLAAVEDRNEDKFGNLGEICETDVNYQEQPLIKIPDSTCSQPVLSEPPHIKNWFSSYVYESPELNTADDFEGSVRRESGCEKELCLKENRRKSEGNLGKQRDFHKNNIVDAVDEELLLKCTNSFGDTCAKKPSSEIPDSSRTPSVLSETEGEEDFIVNQRRREKERNSWEFGQTRITNEVVIDEKLTSNGVLRLKSSSRDDEHENLYMNKLQKQNFVLDDDVLPCQNQDRESKRILILSKDLSEKSETKVQTEAEVPPPGSGDCKTKSCGMNGKENEKKEASEKGFVTTKNRPRLNNENSLYKPKSGLQKCSRKEGTNSSNCGNMAMERRALSERTNLKRDKTIGVTGKWQCPQSRKPKLGPPLKQLRLERWINKL